MTQLQQGSIFADRYELNRALGSGGFSEVWLAHDNVTDLSVAIKIYAPQMGLDENGLKIFAKELANVYDLNHSNLLKPQHVDSWEGKPYLVMSFCPNGSLKNKIGNLSEDEAWTIIREVGAGLAYLHSQGIIHQDIKPDNILINNAGHYLITDFGISTKARTTLRKSTTNAEEFSGGTIEYMGPERFGQNPKPVKASDIWSLGAMMFELMTGDVPFVQHGGLVQKSGAEIPCIEGNYSDELKNLVITMLASEPWDRPTAEQLSQAEKHTQQIRKEPASKPTMPMANLAGETVRQDSPMPQTVREQPVASTNAKFSPLIRVLQCFYMFSYAAVFCLFLNVIISEWNSIMRQEYDILLLLLIESYCIASFVSHLLMFKKNKIGLDIYLIATLALVIISVFLSIFSQPFVFLLPCAIAPSFIYMATLYMRYKGLTGYQVLSIEKMKLYTIGFWSLLGIGAVAFLYFLQLFFRII